MPFAITPEWVAALRRDVKTWDDLAQRGRLDDYARNRPRWKWPDMTLPLKYTGTSANLVSKRRSLRDAGLTLGRSRTIEGDDGGPAPAP